MARILIHGGAWNAKEINIRNREQEATGRSCASVKLKGRSAIDIVEEAVALQELEEVLDAGIGSAMQLDGRIRMDAGICDSEGRYGAVLQIEHVATPIKVARRLLDYGYHSILSGEGAGQFAAENGFPKVSAFVSPVMEGFLNLRRRYPELTYQMLVRDMEDLNKKKLSTVGAVAIDDQGRLAAACSTGGLDFGYPGRVGDTAIFGAGVYCSKHVAVACTGEGDKVLRRLTARLVEDYFLKHGDIKAAAEEAIKDMLEKEKGLCGLIAIASNGESAVALSTTFMSTAEKQA